MKLAFLAPVALATALAGCSATQFADGITRTANDLNTINAALAQPSVQQAIANMRATYGGIVCGVSSLAVLTATIAADVKATKTVNNATIVAMTSQTLCAAAGGVVAAK